MSDETTVDTGPDLEAAGELLLAGIEGETPPELDAEQAAAAAHEGPATPSEGEGDEAKPPPERYEESEQAIWAEARKTRKVARDMKAKAEREMAQIAAEREALASQKRIAELMRTDPVAAMAELAKESGTDPVDFYARLSERHLNDGQPGMREVKSELAALRAENERIRTETEERYHKAQQENRQRFLEARAAEIMGVKEHAALRAQFPYLASIPKSKFADEVLQSVHWAAANRPEWLQDPIAFAERLDLAAKAEYEEWQSEYSSLTTSAGTAKPAPQGNGTRKTPGKTAITATDTASGSAERELSPEERLAKANAMLIGLGD